MQKMSRIICALLVVSFVFSYLWFPAFAAENQVCKIELSEETPQNVRTVHNKAIVIIPGVGGSVLNNSSGQACWLWAGRLDQLECSTSGTSLNSITPEIGGYGLFSYYETLWLRLNSSYADLYDILFFSYDWRLSCADAAEDLVQFVADYDEVILVAHSMGGLVASKFCAMSNANRSKVDKLITLGTPYTGTPELIHVAETGDFHFFVSLVGGTAFHIKELMANFHCTYQLAPTTRYCTSTTDENRYYIKNDTTQLMSTSARLFYSQRPWATLSNGSTKIMYSQATAFHNSLMVSGVHIANSSLVETYKIIGTGYDTITQLIYDANGTYIDNVLTNNGDDTVPKWSAANTQEISATLRTYGVEATHMNLISSRAALDLVEAIIGDPSSLAASYSGLGSVDATSSDVFELPEGVITNLETNEKGWLTSTDNRRIQLVVDADAKIDIDINGDQIVKSGNSLFTSTGDYCGSVWLLGNGKVKYLLKYNNYEIVIDENTSSIEISYMDDGYVESVETYDCKDYSTVYVSLAYSNDSLTTITAANLDTSYSYFTINPESE